MNRASFTIGQKIAAASALFVIAGATMVSAHDTGQSHTHTTLGSKIRLCVQERRADGYFNHDLTRAERRELRAEFRACVRAAIDSHMGRSSSSRSSRSSSSSSVSSGTGSSQSSMSSSRSSRSSSVRSVLKKVDIEDFEYDPAVLNVKVGTTVRWKNEDDAPHTVTSTGSGGLNSGTLDENETYSHTFTASGTYNYHCSFHPNMTGAVIVTE
jgi:plastocyanin